MEEKVLEILRNVFELATVDTNISQQNCEKWDSMGVLNIVVEIEAEFGVSLEPEEISEIISYDSIIRVLKKKGI